MIPSLSSLLAPEVVIMTTSAATNDKWVGVGAFSKIVVTFNHVMVPLIYLWPPLGMSEKSHLFEFGIMYMLSTFHVSSQIVANISESSLLFSQYLFRLYWRKTLPEYYYPIFTLVLQNFAILVGLLLQSVALFQSRELVKYLESL